MSVRRHGYRKQKLDEPNFDSVGVMLKTMSEPFARMAKAFSDSCANLGRMIGEAFERKDN